MTPQDKVNKLARSLVDKNLRSEFVMPFGVRALASALEEALDGVDRPVAPTEPVRATVGCWLTRDGSKAVVKTYYHIVTERPFHGFVVGISESFCWRENGTWNTDPKIPTDFDLLTFISPDVDYWEKEAKKPVGDGITDDTEALQAVLDKSKPFDWTQLPVSFVVSLGEFGSHFPPLRISERGIVIFNSSTKDGYQFYTYEQLAEANALWSTDRKTWREFK